MQLMIKITSISIFCILVFWLCQPFKGQGEKEMSSFRAIFVTVPTIEVGRTIAQGLVSKKLAACVNIVPQITSIYEWEGKINEDNELLLMIKTQNHLFEDIAKFVKENHPYDVPEVISVPIDQGSQPYLDWIKGLTAKAQQ